MHSYKWTNRIEGHLESAVGNLVDRSALVIREYESGLILARQLARPMPYDQPRAIWEAKYLPDLSRARECGWKQDVSESDFVSSATLAEQIVMLLVDLANHKASGKLK